MTDYQNEVLEFERIMKEHTNYMRNSINLIASENITSSDVTEAVASDLAHMQKDNLMKDYMKDVSILMK
jgi:glycine hydroxymethyltransferase